MPNITPPRTATTATPRTKSLWVRPLSLRRWLTQRPSSNSSPPLLQSHRYTFRMSHRPKILMRCQQSNVSLFSSPLPSRLSRLATHPHVLIADIGYSYPLPEPQILPSAYPMPDPALLSQTRKTERRRPPGKKNTDQPHIPRPRNVSTLLPLHPSPSLSMARLSSTPPPPPGFHPLPFGFHRAKER